MSTPPYAGFWIRVGATLIDSIAVIIIITGPLTYIYGQEYWTSDKIVTGFWDVMLGYVLPFLATIWFWLTYRATPGKLLTGLQIVDASSLQTMTFGQALLRYFGFIVAIIPALMGVVWIAFDSRKQGWHDKIANTLVIKEY